MANNLIIPGTNILVSIFDSRDTERLAELGIPQLRREIARSEYLEGYYGGCVAYNTDEVIFEREYQAACKKAIELIRSRQPKPTVTNNKFIDIDSLKSRYDLVDYIGRYTKLHKSGSRHSGKCPLHAGKTQNSIVIYPDNTFHCFGCLVHGSIIDFVMAYDHVDFKGALAILGGS